MRRIRSNAWVLVALAVGMFVVIGGGTGAALCKFTDLQCGLRSPAPPAPPSLEDFSGAGAGEMRVPEGLTASTVVTGLRGPTDFDFLPDGGVVFAEKEGLVRIARGGKIVRRPLLDLRRRVSTWSWRGMVNVTVDPEFPRRPYVYVAYSARGPGGRQAREPVVVRVSRFEVRGDVADPASEKVLLGADGRPGTSCRALPVTSDCIPADGDHLGADMVFTKEGTIFVSTGDGGAGDIETIEPASLAQNTNTLGGKILHIDREGRGVPGNPFWNGNPDANRSKVWATGLRNPFRIALVPGRPKTLIVGDVGWHTYEELDIVERARDYGWPCFEGPERTPKYRTRGFCVSYYEHANPVAPWLSVERPPFYSITGGVPVPDADGWPSDLAGSYVFGDWISSELYAVPLDVDSPAGEYKVFAQKGAGPVAFALRPDGLYVLAVNVGELRRIAPA